MARDIKKIDSKGRFFLPSKLREKFGGDLVATISLEPGFLCVYTAEHFETVKEQFRGGNALDMTLRLLERAIIGESLELSVDSQGRLTLTSELWESIGAVPGDEICVFDTLDRIEICRKSFYETDRTDVTSLKGLADKYVIRGL